MKREEIYSRVYEKEVYDGLPANEDNITKVLGKICAEIPIRKSNFSFYENREMFNYFNGGVMVWIDNKTVRKSPGYERQIVLTIMPPESKTPKELSDLLTEKGFKLKDN